MRTPRYKRRARQLVLLCCLSALSVVTIALGAWSTIQGEGPQFSLWERLGLLSIALSVVVVLAVAWWVYGYTAPNRRRDAEHGQS